MKPPGPPVTLVALLIVACSPPPAPAASIARADTTSPARTRDAARAAVAAPDRSPADRALDAGRRPEELLTFIGVTSGMRVGEIQAGGGYSAELFARAVGPRGAVYGQNNRFVLEKFAETPWSARLTKAVNANIVRVDRELESPFPPDSASLDVVANILFYHDTVWMKVDRARMNAAIFAALKRGGVYVVIDHSAREGDGVASAQTLHRIEESVVRAEVESAGFTLVATSDFLRNAKDTRDWSASPGAAGAQRGASDRFALKFTRP